MKAWIVSVSAVVMITAIINLILPEGKMGKFIKGIFSIFVLLTIIKPIIYIKDGGFNYQNIFNQSNFELQDEFIEYVSQEKINEYENNCQNILEKNGIQNAFVDIFYALDENLMIIIKSTSIDLKNSVIKSDKAHIDIIKAVRKEIASYLNVKEDLVKIYE